MSDEQPNLDSLFLAAREIESLEQRAAFLTQACGGDLVLRSKVEQLLRSHDQPVGSLDQPAPERDAAILPAGAGQERAAAFEAGLATAVLANTAASFADANDNVLRAMEETIDATRIELGDAAQNRDPIVPGKSPVLPDRNSNGRYQFQDEIARGGMGMILKGRDTDLGRDLAIKVLLVEHKHKPDVIQRFIEEAQIGGQLQHPGIVPVYELGQCVDSRPFFSMKLVKGQTLAKLLADRATPASDRRKFLGIFESVCQTVAYAHSRGVIHRDLKPANIMVGAFGEVQVMDWGLAKVLSASGIAAEKQAHGEEQEQSVIQTLRSGVGSDPPGTVGTHGSQTQLGSVMGTPAYMPPEQALGETDMLDERADVFGLGAILCKILTGKPPYVGTDDVAVFRQAARSKLKDCLARLDGCEADADLVALTKHCLEREPQNRPRDAGVLAERVSAYLESVESRLREAELKRAAEAARADEALHTAAEAEAKATAERRARRLQVGLAAVVLVVTATGGLAALWSAKHQSQLKQLAEQAKTRAESEKARADIALADMQTSRGLQAGKDGDAAVAALWFANAALATPHDPVRQAGNRLRAQEWLDEAIVPTALLEVPAGDLRRMQTQPAGALALTLTGTSLRLWDWQFGTILAWSESRNDITDAGFSPDGTQVALVTSSGEVQLIDPARGEIRQRFTTSDRVAVLQWSPDAARLAVGGDRVQIWNVTGAPTRECDWPHPQSVYGLTFNRRGTRLATACQDNQARVFATNDATRPTPLFAAVEHTPHQGSIRMPNLCAPVFSDGDRKVVTILKSRQPGWWDVETGRREPPVWSSASPRNDYSLGTSSDGRWTVASGFTSCLLWSIAGESFELQHPNHVRHTAFHPDGHSLLTTCYDGTARLWPLPSTGKRSRAIPQMQTFSDCIFSPDGAFAAIASWRQVVIWRLPQQERFAGRIAGWSEQFKRPRPGFDGRLATWGARHESPETLAPAGNLLSVAQLSSGEPAGPTITLDGNLWDSCLCSDNRSVAAAYVRGSTGSFAVFDVAAGSLKFSPVTLPSLPQSVAARPGHPHVAVLCQGGQLLVIDSIDGSLDLESTHEGWTRYSQFARVEYSPDGDSLVSTTPENRVFVRDADTGKVKYRSWSPVLEGGPLRTIAFSPDSQLLATGVNGKNAVQVWDLATGQAAAPPLSHPGDFYGIFSVAFSPNGQSILSGHKDGRLRLWDWKSGRLVVPPMQHPDEVYDGQFTPDGRFAVTAVRNSTVHVWDLATGKLAAPPLSYALAQENRNTLSISGSRVITSAPPNYLVIDLAELLQEPEVDAEFLRRRAELAANLKVELGELTTLEHSEWNERWQAYAAARMSPQAEAEALARALDQSVDDTERDTIGRRALRMNLLDRLLALRPDVLQLHVLLIDQLARAGDDVGAARHRKLAIALMEKSRAEWASNPSAVSLLARLLADESMAADFVPLSSLKITTKAGTRLTLQPDGSILADRNDTQGNDAYTIRGHSPIGQITSLRLEVLPHSSLPGGGPGLHSSANFHLTDLRTELQRADGSTVPLAFRGVASDHVRPLDSAITAQDGPWGALDGNHATRWDVWPQVGVPHWLELEFAKPVKIASADELVVYLDFLDPWVRARLGCFRLLVGDDTIGFERRQLAAAVRRHDLVGWEALTAGYLAAGDVARAAELLKAVPNDDWGATRQLLGVLIHQAQGDLAAALETAAQLAESLETQTPPRLLQGLCFHVVHELVGLDRKTFFGLLNQGLFRQELAGLNRTIEAGPASAANFQRRGDAFARSGRWRESADDHLRVVKLNPTSRHAWAIAASALLMAGDEEKYRQHCLAMLKQFKDASAADIADSVCKTCLLLPDVVELSELPFQAVRAGAVDPQWSHFHSYFIACNALISYRKGQPADAIEWANKMPYLAWNGGALALVVRAMSEAQLGRIEHADKSLAEAQSLIPVELRTLGTAEYSGPLPVPEAAIQHDWLVPEILRREAERLINSLRDPDTGSFSKAPAI